MTFEIMRLWCEKCQKFRWDIHFFYHTLQAPLSPPTVGFQTTFFPSKSTGCLDYSRKVNFYGSRLDYLSICCPFCPDCCKRPSVTVGSDWIIPKRILRLPRATTATQPGACRRQRRDACLSLSLSFACTVRSCLINVSFTLRTVHCFSAYRISLVPLQILATRTRLLHNLFFAITFFHALRKCHVTRGFVFEFDGLLGSSVFYSFSLYFSLSLSLQRRFNEMETGF